MTDADHVRRALAGRADAYGELARRWTPRVLAVCHARLRDAAAAEDLAQETLLRGFRKLGTLHEPERFGSWLLGIAVRACLDYLKSPARETARFSELGSDRSLDDMFAPTNNADPHEAADRRRAVWDAVHALPEPLRLALTLFYYDDHTYQELAGLLGVSRSTVNARLSQARALVRARLADYAPEYHS